MRRRIHRSAVDITSLLVCAGCSVLLLTGVAAAQGPERHVAQRQYVPVFEEGQKAETLADSLSEAGRREQAREGYRKAVFHYQRVLILAPHFVPAHVRLARVFGLLGKNLQAAAVLRRIEGVYPDEVEFQELLGVQLFLGGRKGEGIALLERAVLGGRSSFAVLTVLADYYRETQRRRRAIAVLTEILRQQPLAHRRRVELGQALLQSGRIKEAGSNFVKVPSTSRSYAAARMGLADTFMRAGQTREALTTLLRQERSAPKGKRPDKELLLRIAKAQLELGRYSKAAVRYQAVIQQVDKDPRAHFGLGETLRRQKRYREAVASLQRAAQLNTRSPAIFWALARGKAALGSLDQAVSHQRQAVLLAPRDWRLETYLGVLLRRKGDLQGALTLHAGLAEAHPWAVVLLTEIGHDYYYMGKLGEAQGYYDKALGRDPGSMGARRGLVQIGLHRVAPLLQAGKLAVAVDGLTRLLTHNVYQGQILVRLAAVSIARSKPAEAQAWLGRMSRRDRSSGMAQLLRAHVLILAGKGREARESLRKISSDRLSADARLAVRLTNALADFLAKDFDAAVSGLRSLRRAASPPVATDTLLATVLVARANQSWVQGKLRACMADLKEALASKHLSSTDRKRALLLSALAAAERGESSKASAALRKADRGGKPESLLSAGYADRRGYVHLRAYVRYRSSDYRGAMTTLKPMMRRGSGSSQQQLPLYRAVLRGGIYKSYKAGLYRKARAFASEFQRVTTNPTAADENLVACVDYVSNRKAKAVEVFRKLAKALPEARLNLGIHKDVTEGDKKAAYEAYVAYLHRAGASAERQVKDWVETKRRIFGFE